MSRRIVAILVALVALWAGADTFKSFVFYKNGEKIVTVPVVDVDSMVFERPQSIPDVPDDPPVDPPVTPPDTVPDTPGDTLPDVPSDTIPDIPIDTVPDVPSDTIPDIPSDTIPDVPEPPQFEMVDLGLSVQWASMNVGATTPDDYGNYYAWGELEPKDYYHTINYTYEGVDIGKNISATEYDVARATYGNEYRMPTQWECKELTERCEWSWEQYGESGNWGMKVTGPNGNSIFLPAAGFINYAGEQRMGYYGSYWTSTSERVGESYYLCFEQGRVDVTSWDGATYVGQTVRPVSGSMNTADKLALYDFYYSTNGDEWVNKEGWLTTAPLSEWYGIETDANGNVVKISLPDNNLSGECLIDERLSHLVEVDFRGARFDRVSICPGESMKTLVLDNCMDARGKVENINVDKFILRNVPDMGALQGVCDTIEVYNCQFAETDQPLGGVSALSVKISGCEMKNIGGSANEIYVEDSRVTETWYFMTREKFTAINSYLSTLCSGDFNEGCLLTFDNVTLWRTNWKDETITVTCSFVFDSNTWNEYFP